MRVLVVEDDADLARQLHDCLGDAGYAVDLAPTARRATISAPTSPTMPWCSISACRGHGRHQRPRALAARGPHDAGA